MIMKTVSPVRRSRHGCSSQATHRLLACAQEAWLQLSMTAPLAAANCLQFAQLMITTAEAGRSFDTASLAAVSLSETAYYSFNKLVR